MAPSSYPPPASKSRASKQHGHHRSLSSNANTLINAADGSDNMNDGGGRALNPPPPPSAYTRPETGRKGNHRAKPSAYSMTSTLADRQSPIPLAQHDRSKSGSSILKNQEDPQSPPPPVTAGRQAPYDGEPSKPRERTCCGVIQESVDRAREERLGPEADQRPPQPWIVLKLMVAVTLGFLAYGAYVYVGVLVVPMLKERPDAQGTRREGIGLLVGFGVLYLWMLWAYFKIVTTPPGYARDHVPLTPKPPCVGASGVGSPSPRPSQTLSSANRPSQDSRYTLAFNDRHAKGNIAGPSYEQLSEMVAATPGARTASFDASRGLATAGQPLELRRSPSEPTRNSRQMPSESHPANTLTVPKPSLVDRTTSNMTVKSIPMSVGSTKSARRFNEGEMVSGSPMKETEDDVRWDNDGTVGHEDGRTTARKLAASSQASLSLKEILEANQAVPRGPAGEADLEAGVLDSVVAAGNEVTDPSSTSRLKWLLCCCWCLAPDENGKAKASGKSRAAKPRAYIRRSIPSTAVLDPYNRYCEKDGLVKPYRAHHCRNCGTCVLRYDHHCPWIGQCVGARNHKFFVNFCQSAFAASAYMVGSMIPYTNRGFNDPTKAMNAQQIVVIALAGIFCLFTFSLMASHIYMTLMGQTTVENMQIQTLKERESETLSRAYRWYEFRGKLKTVKEWDREWGSWSTEGNIWWIGPRRREWEAVMGKNPLGWILPIGRSPSDGLDYPVNPRFDAVTGTRKRREEWPQELRR